MSRNTSKKNGCYGLQLLAVGVLIISQRPVALSQTNHVQPASGSAVTAPSAGPTPAYEVATIKPPQENEYGPLLRVYIQSAFGIPVNSVGWVIGPDWINNARYVIQAKPPEPIRDAMQTMSPAERSKTVQTMQQGLLADRFKLKAHFETRDMPIYKLVLAKGGSQLKEDPDSTKARIAVSASMIRGTAISIRNLLGALESVPDVGGRVVTDETGLTGTYDFLLKWTPMQNMTPQGSPGEASPSSNLEGVSLFAAIEEQLGLKLVPTKGPGQILIIDHIEQPSEN